MEVKIVNKSGFDLPQYETSGSAGIDVRSSDETYILEPNERKIFKTGLFLEIPKGFEVQVRSRSGLAAKHGVIVLNSPGTIDSDYRGEVGVILLNTSQKSFKVDNSMRIAQLVFAEYKRAQFIPVRKLSSTDRGDGGFGSTGLK